MPRREGPVKVCRYSPEFKGGLSLSLLSPRPAAVRSAARHREAGNRPERFLAASSVRTIRDV